MTDLFSTVGRRQSGTLKATGRGSVMAGELPPLPAAAGRKHTDVFHEPRTHGAHYTPSDASNPWAQERPGGALWRRNSDSYLYANRGHFHVGTDVFPMGQLVSPTARVDLNPTMDPNKVPAEVLMAEIRKAGRKIATTEHYSSHAQPRQINMFDTLRKRTASRGGSSSVPPLQDPSHDQSSYKSTFGRPRTREVGDDNPRSLTANSNSSTVAGNGDEADKADEQGYLNDSGFQRGDDDLSSEADSDTEAEAERRQGLRAAVVEDPPHVVPPPFRRTSRRLRRTQSENSAVRLPAVAPVSFPRPYTSTPDGERIRPPTKTEMMRRIFAAHPVPEGVETRPSQYVLSSQAATIPKLRSNPHPAFDASLSRWH
eukprot:m.488031 g.488031  ORF g.488031 m.488031 type:complete len:370 (-) comp25494_c0_seq1:101-1210(-)